MENKKMIINDLTYDEVALLLTSLKTMIIKMKELQVTREWAWPLRLS